MIPKNSSVSQVSSLKKYKSLGGKILGFGILLELVCLGISYVGFNKVHSSPDTRKYLSKTWPSILEGYYHITDSLAGNNIRGQDQIAWALSDDVWSESDT